MSRSAEARHIQLSPQKCSAVHRLHGEAVGDTWDICKAKYLELYDRLGVARPGDLADYEEHELWINSDNEVAYCVSIDYDEYHGWSAGMTHI